LPDEYLNEIEKNFKKVLNQIYNGKTPSNKVLETTGKTLAQQVQNSYGNITPDLTTPDAEMLVRLTRDVWQFSAAKNYQQMRDLTLALRDENGTLREWNDFKEAAEKLGEKYNVTWMRSEYDNAIAGAQNAARWTEYEKNADIMPNLQYQTVGDGSVRESHQLLNGIVRPMKDSFWNTNYPPNGWGCRCEALQVPNDEKVTPKEQIPQTPIAPMFRTNLAKQGLIFPKGHPYYTGIPQSELRKAILHLPPENTYVNVFIDKHSIDIHPLHGEQELYRNIETCNTLLKHDADAKLKLLPIINDIEIDVKHKFYPQSYIDKFGNKNADAIYNGKVVEFEEPTLQGKNSIKNAIRGGKEQADFVILRIDNNVNWFDIERQVNGQLQHYAGQNFNLWIMNENELRKYKPKSK